MKRLYISHSASPEIIENLKKRGYAPILLPPSPLLPTPVASHADMLMYKLGDKLLLCEYYAKENSEIFSPKEIILTDETHGNKYPHDILFNCFEFRGKLYGKTENLSKYITDRYKNASVGLKQGYAKCSCIVTPDVCITADDNIAQKLGDKCLHISSGGVNLPGYDIGFIGGASFYDEDTVYFFGKLSSHADGEAIEDTLDRCGISTVELSDSPLIDLGGCVVCSNGTDLA